MNSILQAKADFDSAIDHYAEDERDRPLVQGKDKFTSTLIGGMGTFSALIVADLFNPKYGDLGTVVGNMTLTDILPGVIAGVAAYAAHQAWPFLEQNRKLTGSVLGDQFGDSISGAFKGFGQAAKSVVNTLGSVGDVLGLSSHARALKKDADFVKSVLRVDSMSEVKSISRNVYGKDDSYAAIHNAQRLREGIDIAVKDKLKSGDKTPLSYNDIEVGVLKYMDKHKMLGASVESMKGQDDHVKNAILLIANANPENLKLSASGNFGKIADSWALNVLVDRDKNKGGPTL